MEKARKINFRNLWQTLQETQNFKSKLQVTIQCKIFQKFMRSKYSSQIYDYNNN